MTARSIPPRARRLRTLAAMERLSRWQEHSPVTRAATWLGVNMAAYHAPAALDGRVLKVTAA
ncbi:hypothetical protein, partial [Candidatus Roseilinea sp. NK_OTU-006]|uniref:hypothetical protein n=1 Tax=Candidatus Roseilinea sp. NK_OTU-006 TaxID=2704250 RepID=UPI00145EC5A0